VKVVTRAAAVRKEEERREEREVVEMVAVETEAEMAAVRVTTTAVVERVSVKSREAMAVVPKVAARLVAMGGAR